MKHLNKQPTAIVTILIFSIGLMLSWDIFADGGKKATQADLDTEISDRISADEALLAQINSTTYAVGDPEVESYFASVSTESTDWRWPIPHCGIPLLPGQTHLYMSGSTPRYMDFTEAHSTLV